MVHPQLTDVCRAARRALAILGLFAPAALIGACEASTDEICTDTCHAWETCRDPNPPYSFRQRWDYGVCFAQCKDDGDWDWSYYRCVSAHNHCGETEPACG